MNEVRVTPWQDGEPVPAELLSAIRARRPKGELIGIDRVLLKSFPLATGWNELLGRVRAEFTLPLVLREMIMLRVAALNQAEFEWQVHYPAYIKAGGSPVKAEKLRDNEIAEVFDEKEAVLLKLTDQSTLKVAVDEEVIYKVKDIFGEQQTVEAVATVGAYNMVSRFLVALNI